MYIIFPNITNKPRVTEQRSNYMYHRFSVTSDLFVIYVRVMILFVI